MQQASMNPSGRPVLITGAGGQLGQALQRTLGRFGPVVGLDRRALDLTDAEAVAARIAAERPIAVVNAAAYTAVDRAEEEADLAMTVNGVAPGVLAAAAANANACFIHYSTDYVFAGDGTRP